MPVPHHDDLLPTAADGDGMPPEMLVARGLAVAVRADRVALVLSAGPLVRGAVRGGDPLLLRLGDMVETAGEGPEREVLTGGAPCATDDLVEETARWPLLTSTYVLPRPLRSLLAVPLVPRGATSVDDVVGVLVLARDERRPFAAGDVAAARAGAAVLAEAVLLRAADVAEDPLRLGSLLDPGAAVVPRAAGVVAARDGLVAAEAHELLRVVALREGRTTREVAERVLAGEA